MALPILFSALGLWGFANPMSDQVRLAAARAELDAKLVEAIIRVESNFNPTATSPKGANGLMQVMPTFTDECEIHSAVHITDSLMGACDCLRRLLNRYRGNLQLALAAYNAGPTQVDRYSGVPPFPETRKYVERVLENYQKLVLRDKVTTALHLHTVVDP